VPDSRLQAPFLVAFGVATWFTRRRLWRCSGPACEPVREASGTTGADDDDDDDDGLALYEDDAEAVLLPGGPGSAEPP